MTTDDGTASPVGASSVVLLRDTNWPVQAGVCCWRGSVHVTFTAHGLAVHEVDWTPPSSGAPDAEVTTPAAPGRAMAPTAPPEPSVAGVAARFVARAARAGAYAAGRRARAAAGRVGREFETRVSRRGTTGAWSSSAGTPGVSERPRAAGAQPPDPALAGLADARLVLAESPEAAVAAVHSGVPAGAVWVLAIPPERAAPGEPVTWAAPLREAAPVVGGLIADSPDAAGVLERVAGPVRTVVFPPLASDRTCPTCGGGPADPATGVTTVPVGAEAGMEADAEEGARALDGTDLHPADVPGHLLLWRRLLDEAAVGNPRPTEYSYPVARLRGETGPWAPPRLDPWGPERSTGVGEPAPDWTTAAQRAGVERLLASLPPVVDLAGAAPVRVRVFGHDLKFMRELADVLGERAELDVAVDEWRTAGAKNDGITENLARSAQTLVAEWARPNAIWLSQVKRPDQHLVVRLHRFEIESAYPQRIDIDAVDAVVYIAPHMGRRIRDELGWPVEKLVYVPNYTDLAGLDRPKHPGARFTLGMVGIVPSLKRFDLALDLLAAVRREDPRFTLLVRSQMGWAHPPSWQNAAERHEAQRCLERVEKDPLLRGAVGFDAFGRDMPAWYRKVGHILSLSDVEGSHAALCEGMGSGAVPVIRGWQGAAEAYGENALCGSLDEAAARVLENADPDTWEQRSVAARQEVASRFDPTRVVEAWVDLAYGHVDQARARFEAYADKSLRD